MHKLYGVLIGLAVVAVGVRAPAQRKVDNIGNGGGIVIGAERLAGVYHAKSTSETSVSTAGVNVTAETEISRTAIAVFGHDPASPTQVPRISLDYFPVEGLSLGGGFMYLRLNGDFESKQRVTVGGTTATADTDGKVPTETLLVVHPRIGYAFAFNEFVGIWPRVGFSYTRLERVEQIRVTDAAGAEQRFEETTTDALTHLTLEGQLFVSPFTGFAFVGGPFADIGLGGKSEFESTEPNVPDGDADTKSTVFGFMVGVAGYFDTQ